MFSQADFQGDNLHRLCVITMHSIGKHPMTQFHMLSNVFQKEFDKKMNSYINNLPSEGWESVILDDFDTIFHTEILCDDSDISRFRCDNVITDPQNIPKENGVIETPENIMSEESIDESELRKDIWRPKEGTWRVYEYVGIAGK